MIAPSTAAVADSGQVLADMVHVSPLMIVGLWSLLLVLSDAFAGSGRRTFQRRLALVGVGMAAAATVALFGDVEYDGGRLAFYDFLIVDQFSLLLDLGILAVAAGVLAFGGDYARSHRFEFGEQEAVVLIAAFGMMMLIHASDLAGLFLGVETMSIAVYVLVGSRWNSRASSEGALKYFIMGAFSSALLLLGIALIYGATGTMELHELSASVSLVFTKWGAAQPYVDTLQIGEGVPPGVLRVASDRAVTGIAPAALFIPGMLLTLAGLLFKISAAPFHMWTPDAYEGAPTPITGFMAAGVKIAGFAALLKLFVGVFNTQRLVTAPYGWTTVVGVLALLTMTVGNLAAVRQSNVKRLLAYSSIAHVGYILIGVVAAANFYGTPASSATLAPLDQLEWSKTTGDTAVSAVVYYLLTYAVATVGIFACVAWFSADKREATSVHQWAGLASRHPAMALGMTVCLLSLMGMPPTAGFIGKLVVFRAAFENDNMLMRVLVVAALLNSVVGAYYYLRIIVAMYFRPAPDRPMPTLGSRGARAVVAVAAVASLVLGLGADSALRRTDLAASGFQFPPGNARAQWVDKLRERWEKADTEPDEPTHTDDPIEPNEAAAAAKRPTAPPAQQGAAP